MEMTEAYKKGYNSPRISSELLDCSLAFSFDDKSVCAFNCMYCFAFYQRSTNPSCDENYLKKEVRVVTLDGFKRLFLGKGTGTSKTMYEQFVKNRVPFHWGGLSDPFCWFERIHKTGLEMIKFLDSINYPTIFSTKGVVCTDPEYLEIFKRNPKNWAFQFSIITSNDEDAKKIEAGAPSPTERLKAMKILSDIGCKTILRFRPYIIGVSNKTAVDLITKSKEAGASAVSCEFFCLDTRGGDSLKNRYKIISEVAGFDIYDYYRRTSIDQGYLRLNPKVKRKYALEVYRTTKKLGMTIHFSDPDFKELNDSGCCCGLTEQDENFKGYLRGQFSEALRYARQNKIVTFDFIEQNLEWAKHFVVGETGVNFIGEHLDKTSKAMTKTVERTTVFDFFRNIWNNPNSAKSPYKYFHGKLKPIGLDEKGNVIYKYNKEKWEETL